MNVRILIAAFAAFSFVSLAASADDQAQWEAARQAEFAQWTKAHSGVDAKIADLKAKTAVMLGKVEPLDKADIDRPSTIWRMAGPAIEIWDDPAAPQMVAIPAGEFTMGAPIAEPGRFDREGPPHRVRIGYTLAVAKYDVTVAEFAQFVAETGFDPGNQCFTYEPPKGEIRAGRNWRNPAFTQTIMEPVLCVTWDAAQAYAVWLSKKTGHSYRLLSDAEYEYANRAGTATAFWWGDDVGANHANCDGCGDLKDYKQTSPVGSFAANPFGLFDTTGDAWSWVQDCWNKTYDGAPVDGSADLKGDCAIRIIRGGGWHNEKSNLRSASRVWSHPGHQDHDVGFRLARTL